MKLSQVKREFELIGGRPTYEHFIYFVETELAPYMGSKFIVEDYYKDLYDKVWKKRHNLYQLPRGHSKTELMGIWVTIFLAVTQPINPFYKRYKKKIKEQMLIAGDGAAMAAWSERIKHFFYENPKLNLFVPEGVNSKKQNTYWNTQVMYLANGHKIILRAIGDKAIRGNHVDRLHVDDLVTENSTIVDSKIIEKWDGAVDGTTTNKLAMVQVTGTPLRFTDILFHLQKRGYNFTRLPAIISFEKKIILSPNRWTYKDLMDTKGRIGTVRFQCEYMLDPLDDSTSLIKREWITQCQSTEFDIVRERPPWAEAVYLGVDFAFSDRALADNSIFFTFAEFTRDDKKYFIMLDYIKKKGLSGQEQMDLIQDLNSSYKYDAIGLEENSIKAIVKNIAQDMGHLPIKRFWTGNSDEKEGADPTKGFTTVSKRNLILRLGTAFEMKEIILPYKSEEAQMKVDELINECVSFAQEEGKIVEIGVHPDIPIAMAYSREVAIRWGNGFLI